MLRFCTLLAVGALGGMALPGTAAAYSPTNITGLTIWIDASDVNNTGSNPAHGTGVATWVNKAGAFNATQGNSSLRPVMAGGVLNGLDVVRFTRPAFNSARYLEFNNTAIATLLNKTNTAIAVARANNGGGDSNTQRSMYVFARPGWHSGMMLSGHPSATSTGTVRWLGSKAANIGQSLPYTQGEFRVISRTVKGTTTAAPSSIQLFLVHTNLPATANATYALWDHSPNQNIMRLGCAHISGDYTGGLDGDIAEILFYNRELSTDERQELEGYLSWKWGLEDSLPAGHPYEHSAPGIDPAVPIIANQPVSAITDTSATFNGWLVSTGTSDAAVRVYWGTEDGELSGEWGNTNWWDAGAWATNTFPATNITGLAQNTTYYYTFGAVNATTNAVAKPRISFKTLGPPAVDTAAGATSVGVSTATLNGTLANGAPASVFFDWWANGGDVTNRVELGAPRELGGFSANLTALTPSTDYRYQTVATNAYGTARAAASNFTTLASVVTGGNVTWSGAGVTPFWDVPANWAGNAAPTNPTAATVTFGINGQAVTSFLDADRQVSGITFGADRYFGPMSHTVNLNGTTLTVAGSVARTQWEDQTLNFTSGTLRIGTASSAGNLNLGQDYGSADLRMQPGAVLDTFNLSSVTLGYPEWGPAGHGRLDLRGAVVADGVFKANNVYMRGGGHHAAVSAIQMNAQTSISRIEFAGTVQMGRSHGGVRSYIGDTATYRLPPNVSMKIGVSPQQRGSLTLGHETNQNRLPETYLMATSGGRFEAYLTVLDMLRQEQPRGTLEKTGILDIGGMTNCLIDAQTINIGIDHRSLTPDPGDNFRATMILCPGVVTAGTVRVGATLGTGWGRLTLSNTLFTVTNSLVLNRTGQITIRLDDQPSGLDVDGSFTDASVGTITVHFLSEPAAGATNWAIRIKGNVQSTLNAMIGSVPARLTSTGTYPGMKAGVLYDAAAGYTYYALAASNTFSTLPNAIAHAERTYELAPGSTVTIGTADIDNNSNDPDGRPLTLTISTNGGPESASLTFEAAGDYVVTLTATAGGESATDDCTVHVVDVHAGVASGNLTWQGEAPTALMDRREWMWSDNWSPRTPPAAVTTGSILFGHIGQSISGVIERNRQVGGISFGSDTVDTYHSVNLGGNTLTVAGTISRTASRTQSLTFTNGTLRVGGDSTAGNIDLGPQYGMGTLLVSPGTVLDTHNINTVTLGYPEWGPNGRGYLDLRGATLARGTLSMRNLYMRAGAGGNSHIYLNEHSTLSLIAIERILHLCTVHTSGSAYIGNPSDNGRLPPGISVSVGVSPSERGRFWISQVAASISTGTTDGRLVASGGGQFTAYVDNLDVVRQETTLTGSEVRGVLNIGAMTNCLIDAQTISVGSDRYTTPNAAYNIRGTLVLCPGVVTAGTVVIGATAGTGFGLIEMSNTVFTVTNTLTVAKTGDIVVRVGTTSSGVDILRSDADALAVDADATITLRFLEPAASQPHYGFRWAGNHTDTLVTMRGLHDGRLVIDDAALARPAEIYKLHGATYVGIPPPGGTLFLVR